jgi:hypothetical protein
LDKQVTLITIFSLFFVSGIFCLTIMLTMLRQIRHRRQVILAEYTPPAKLQTGTMRRITSTQPMVRITPIPDKWRIPVQTGTPNQVILSIEPEEGPTGDQRNVQKLIDFLKREAVQKAS